MSEMEGALYKPEEAESPLKNTLDPEIVRGRSLLLDPFAIAQSRFPEALQKLNRDISDLWNERARLSAELGVLSTQEKELSSSIVKNYEETKLIKAELGAQNQKLITKLFNLLGMKDSASQRLESRLSELNQQGNDNLDVIDNCRALISRSKAELAKLPTNNAIERSFNESMLSQALTQEEKVALLKPEILKTLSVDEFFTVWRRLDPWFVSHVTRQGIRDHNSMWEHSAGLEEWHDSAKKIFESDSRLLTPFAAMGLKSFTESDIRDFLARNILQAPSDKEAQHLFRSIVNASLAAAPNYPDKTAVHFAVQTVLDEYYGGESHNEVFFIIPADVIASQHLFHSSKNDLDRPDQGKKFNDLFVWPLDYQNPFISGNNGICFLPRSTLVDPETGSKYATKLEVIDGRVTRSPVRDGVLSDKVTKWLDDLGNNQSIMTKVQLLYAEKEKLSGIWAEKDPSIRAGREFQYQIRDQSRIVEATKKYLSSSIAEQLSNLGVPLESSKELADLITQKVDEARGAQVLLRDIDDRFKESINFKFKLELKRADSPVTAEQFWKGYFEKNPSHAPARIVFYDGNPTQAIRDCLFERDVYSEPYESDPTTGKGGAKINNPFEEFGLNKTDMPTTPEPEHRVYAGHADLMLLGEKIIEDYYRSK